VDCGNKTASAELCADPYRGPIQQGQSPTALEQTFRSHIASNGHVPRLRGIHGKGMDEFAILLSVARPGGADYAAVGRHYPRQAVPEPRNYLQFTRPLPPVH
jgi:hypothetical protein